VVITIENECILVSLWPKRCSRLPSFGPPRMRGRLCRLLQVQGGRPASVHSKPRGDDAGICIVPAIRHPVSLKCTPTLLTLCHHQTSFLDCGIVAFSLTSPRQHSLQYFGHSKSNAHLTVSSARACILSWRAHRHLKCLSIEAVAANLPS